MNEQNSQEPATTIKEKAEPRKVKLPCCQNHVFQVPASNVITVYTFKFTTNKLHNVFIFIRHNYYMFRGTAVAQWLRCCATNRKGAGSIPDGVIGIFL